MNLKKKSCFNRKWYINSQHTHNFIKMKLVNANFHGALNMDMVNLEEYIFHPGRPTFYKKTSSDGTILVFPSGKFRAMGKNMTPAFIMDNLPVSGKILFQGATYSGAFNKRLNLLQLSEKIKYRTMYEPELFNSLSIYLPDGGGIINLFPSGKYVCMGSAPQNKFAYYIYKIAPLL